MGGNRWSWVLVVGGEGGPSSDVLLVCHRSIMVKKVLWAWEKASVLSRLLGHHSEGRNVTLRLPK